MWVNPAQPPLRVAMRSPLPFPWLVSLVVVLPRCCLCRWRDCLEPIFLLWYPAKGSVSETPKGPTKLQGARQATHFVVCCSSLILAVHVCVFACRLPRQSHTFYPSYKVAEGSQSAVAAVFLRPLGTSQRNLPNIDLNGLDLLSLLTRSWPIVAVIVVR